MNPASEPTELKKPSTRRGGAGLPTRFRTRIMAGLVLILPIWITFLLVSFVFRLMRDASLWVVEGFLVSRWGAPLLTNWGVTPEALAEGGLDVLPWELRWGVAIYAVLVTVTLLYVLGLVTSNIIGRRIVHAGEAFVDRLPMVKTVYRASKQVLETFAGASAGAYQRVALVPFPSAQVRSIGFVTRIFRDAATGEEYCAVFIATTPNPTSGFVFLVKRTEIVELDLAVEEAVKIVMSAGVLTPGTMTITPPSPRRTADG
ncbi:MAG: DUF502 domain-containing protein [Planctomycetota bacterium]